MKRFLTFLVLLSAGALWAQSPAPAPPPYPETISVSGEGKSKVVPDRFSFSVGVQTMAPTVEEAVNENNRRTANVIAALKQAGTPDRDIRTSNFSIWPQQDFSQGRVPRILGYQVSNNITVTRDKIAEAGRLLQIAVNAGVNTSSGLQFEVSDPARGRDQGLRAAFEDAKSKATLLAQAAGRTLGRTVSITEGIHQAPPYPPPYPMAVRAAAAQVESDVPVAPGEQERTYTISVIFELR